MPPTTARCFFLSRTVVGNFSDRQPFLSQLKLPRLTNIRIGSSPFDLLVFANRGRLYTGPMQFPRKLVTHIRFDVFLRSTLVQE
jgi:hypothetical protein